jgi:hypothetical protein
MTHAERILDFLRSHPEGADDDQLAAALHIPHREAVNQTCRRLAAGGQIVRRPDPVSGKLINRVMTEGYAPLPVQDVPPRPPVRTGQVLRFRDEDALRAFAYAGELKITEDQVKQAVHAVLQTAGWHVETRWGHLPGIDIEATRGTDRLVVEAKGEGTRPAMRVNFLLGALGELLQRMDTPDARYGLALPAHRQFVGLICRLPIWVRTHLSLHFWLVRIAADGQLEVGLFPADSLLV